MFTGLITEIGTVTAITPFPGGIRWKILAPKTVAELNRGDSVSIAGACQTAEKLDGDSFSGTSIQETLKATNFGDWSLGSRVNLELPLRASDRIGGHFVTGHVDTTGAVRDIRNSPEGHWVGITFDAKYDRWVLHKGSMAIEGVSLTIMEKEEGLITVSLIPETVARTILGDLRIGQRLNLEFDMLVKAVVPELNDLSTARGEHRRTHKRIFERAGWW